MTGRAGLRADCARCSGLCCVALPFAASADFAADKKAGDPCGHLRADFRCGIHARLRDTGYRGCTVFDCFGAGQRVTQETFGGRDWRAAPEIAGSMVAVFPVMRALHELLWYIADALAVPEAAALHADLEAAARDVERLAGAAPETLADTDVNAVRDSVNALLLRTSELARAPFAASQRTRRGADLVGAKLRRARLRGANLRGVLLIAADLREADLRRADLIGADLRDADIRGADLTDALFLTAQQVASARGDATTRLPAHLPAPAHW
ncbi:pentapeptide repeat-containing protein [Actinomadura atramentaria]|uniref:pentapeptide repeat-containing protein n=1 Tax=Actinomadura atramentaria TaxID=1990 RepID=UPI00037BF290|nr:pentapeptide repeat-containing protein [Actinomadura atramentaria]